MTNPISPPPRVPPGHEAPPRLTVLLTLLGRHEFTPRWFAHAARELPGARVLVADGSHDDQAATLVSEAARAHGGLAIEYRRFAPDRGVADYQRKLATSLASVQTPYVMLADNDDFHIGEGVRHAVAALEARPELGTARGRVAHLVVRGATGSLPFPIHARGAWAFDYEFFQPLDARRAEERLRAHGRRYAPSWYAVMRAPLAARWSAALAERPLADLGLIEWLQAAICCASAPQLVGEWPFLFRQYNVTSKSSATALSRGDQLDAALAEGWSLEASRVLELSAQLVAQHDGLPLENARAAAHGALHDYLETRVLRQAFSRKGRRATDARWLASVAGGRLVQRYLAGSWFRAMAAAGLRTGPARGIERVLPALRGDATPS